jgi:undecaprenyl pyrophosphate synthase
VKSETQEPCSPWISSPTRGTHGEQGSWVLVYKVLVSQPDITHSSAVFAIIMPKDKAQKRKADSEAEDQKASKAERIEKLETALANAAKKLTLYKKHVKNVKKEYTKAIREKAREELKQKMEADEDSKKEADRIWEAAPPRVRDYLAKRGIDVLFLRCESRWEYDGRSEERAFQSLARDVTNGAYSDGAVKEDVRDALYALADDYGITSDALQVIVERDAEDSSSDSDENENAE